MTRSVGMVLVKDSTGDKPVRAWGPAMNLPKDLPKDVYQGVGYARGGYDTWG